MLSQGTISLLNTRKHLQGQPYLRDKEGSEVLQDTPPDTRLAGQGAYRSGV
jgi:hypothetical protein